MGIKDLVSGRSLLLTAALGCSIVLSPAAQAVPCWELYPIFGDGFEHGITSIWGAPGVCPQGWVVLPGSVLMGFVLVPGGVFEMGSPPTERGRQSDETLHEVTLTRDYWMSTTEVTQAQWEAVYGFNPSWFSACGGSCPVEYVSWWEAASFANAVSARQGLEQCYSLTGCTGTFGVDMDCLGISFAGLDCTGYRLPTEAEWERAARAGTQSRFSHGDVLEADDVCQVPSLHESYMWWCGNNTPNGTKPVTGKLPNDYGLYDMHGNVFEWTWDVYASEYGAAPVTDPTGPPAFDWGRNVRGGYWNTYTEYCRSARRLTQAAGNRGPGIGFRLVRSD